MTAALRTRQPEWPTKEVALCTSTLSLASVSACHWSDLTTLRDPAASMRGGEGEGVEGEGVIVRVGEGVDSEGG